MIFIISHSKVNVSLQHCALKKRSCISKSYNFISSHNLTNISLLTSCFVFQILGASCSLMANLGSFFLLVSLLHLDPLQACRTGTHEECDTAPFVPSHSLVGEGFDVVTLQHKGAYVVDMQTYLTPTNTCTLCENPLMNDQLQKLPLSVLDWRAFSSCSQNIFSSVFTSISSLLESSSSSIQNDWKLGIDLEEYGNLQLSGSQSTEYNFASHRQSVDKTSFTSHELTCTHYRSVLRLDIHTVYSLSCFFDVCVSLGCQYENFLSSFTVTVSPVHHL